MPVHPHPVRLAALARGETLKDVAAAVGVTSQSLYSALRGNSWPGLRARLAEHLGLPADVLFPEAGTERRVAAERVAQGLAPTINDPTVLATIAAVIARGGVDHAGAA